MDKHFETIRAQIEREFDTTDAQRQIALAALGILEQVVTDLHTIAETVYHDRTNRGGR